MVRNANDPRPGKKIALMGPFGFGNLGDAAIQDAIIQNIRRRHGDAKIYGISQNPEDTQRRHGIPSFPLNRTPPVGAEWDNRPHENVYGRLGGRLHKSRVGRLLERVFIRVPLELFYVLRSLKNFWTFNLLVVSGGGQLDDFWGGAWAHPYTLAKWGTIARVVGARFVFVSVGAGPIDGALSKMFLRYALSLAEYRSYRDERSRALVESIGFHSKDPVYPDLAYSIPVEVKRGESRKEGRMLIGIGPMSYAHPKIWPKPDRVIYEGYLRKLATFTVWLLGEGYDVKLFPSEVGSDRVAITDLRAVLAIMGVTPADGRVTQAELRTVNELLEHLSQTDIVVASRFHGVLLGHAMKKPVVALSYHQKVDALMEEMGHSSYCLDIRLFTAESLQEAFARLRTNLPAARERIALKTQEYRDALDRQYDLVFS